MRRWARVSDNVRAYRLAMPRRVAAGAQVLESAAVIPAEIVLEFPAVA